jgi:Ser/Thr protein kinase RdoA (MazF antagonist)
MWGVEDLLLGPKSLLDAVSKSVISEAFTVINKTVDALYAENKAQIIHADLHGWNVMWHEGKLAIFDFDDCGFGLPIQDIATATYYLDTPEQDQALLEGYTSVRPLPPYTDFDMKSLLLHRRLMLLNYLYETENQEHQEMLPDYLVESIRRAQVYLSEAMSS